MEQISRYMNNFNVNLEAFNGMCCSHHTVRRLAQCRGKVKRMFMSPMCTHFADIFCWRIFVDAILAPDIEQGKSLFKGSWRICKNTTDECLEQLSGRVSAQLIKWPKGGTNTLLSIIYPPLEVNDLRSLLVQQRVKLCTSCQNFKMALCSYENRENELFIYRPNPFK